MASANDGEPVCFYANCFCRCSAVVIGPPGRNMIESAIAMRFSTGQNEISNPSIWTASGNVTVRLYANENAISIAIAANVIAI